MIFIDRIFKLVPMSSILKVLIILFLYFITPVINDPVLNEFQNLLKISCLLVIIISFMLVSVANISFLFNKIINIVFNVFFLFFATNLLLAEFGQMALTFFTEQPETQFLFFIEITFLLLSALTIYPYIINSTLKSTAVDIPHFNEFHDSTKINRIMTESDINLVGAHETGHLLLSFLYGEFPPSFRAEIYHLNKTNIHGFVSNIVNDNISSYKNYDLWRMHVLLSGQLGEKFLTNINSNGASSDYEKWQDLAVHYLKNQFEGLYFINPKSDSEFEHNKKMISNLKNYQTESILNFMERNRSVMEELHKNLVHKKLLLKEDLDLYFDRIDFLIEMPYPNGRAFFKKDNEDIKSPLPK